MPDDEQQVEPKDDLEAAQMQPEVKEEDLVVPYSREEIVADDTDDTEEDESEVDDNSESDSVDEPTSFVTTQDPGEYQPADYSFETTLAGGKTVTISTPEEAEKLAEDADNFETPKQLLDFIKKSTAMQAKLDKDYDKWETAKKEFDEQSASNQERQEAITGIANEMEYLVGKGKLPAVAKGYADADWSDADVAKQPGVKEQLALLRYMTKENAIRAKANIKPFGPVDAYTAMQADAAEVAKANRAKDAGKARKAASSRVAGVAPAAATPYVPKGIAVGRTGVFDRGASQWD